MEVGARRDGAGGVSLLSPLARVDFGGNGPGKVKIEPWLVRERKPL